MKTAIDHYDPRNMFRREVFNASMDFLESKTLTEREVVECLKECLEFFWSNEVNQTVVRDFCIVKVKRGDRNAKT